MRVLPRFGEAVLALFLQDPDLCYSRGDDCQADSVDPKKGMRSVLVSSGLPN